MTGITTISRASLLFWGCMFAVAAVTAYRARRRSR